MTTYRALALLACTATACGGERAPRQTHEVSFEIGGAVAYQGDSEFLPGATVTITRLDGSELTATTNSAGIWAVSDLSPGVYGELYELPGYEPLAGVFSLEAFGENDVANVFVSRPVALLTETPLRLRVEPFGTTVGDGEFLIDGVAGETIVYSRSAHSAIELTATLPIYSHTNVYVLDGLTGDFAIAILDTASRTIFTIPAGDIDGMNGGLGITADQDPFSLHSIVLDSVGSFLPIHGDVTTVDAVLRFNAEP